MKKLLSLMMFVLLVSFLPAQRVEIRFEGLDGNDQPVQMDSVVVTNVTKNWTETVYAPSLTLVMTTTGVEHYVQSGHFGLSQNIPNPFDGVTRATLNVVERGDVLVNVTDISGRVVASRHISSAEEGTHQIRVTLGSTGLYFLTAQQNGRTSTVKMMSRGGGGANTVEYMGITGPAREKSQKWVRSDKPWDYGDSLSYVGYITLDDPTHTPWGQPMQTRAYASMRESGSLMSQTVTLWFPTRDATSCIGSNPVMDNVYDGNYYHAMWLGRQCWMATNLRSEHYADGTPIARGDQEDLPSPYISYTTGYYYYPDGNTNVSAGFGLLYNWAAVMRGTSSSNENPSGVQGICPNGWHVPSFDEWSQLYRHLVDREEFGCNGAKGLVAKVLATQDDVWAPSTLPCTPGYDPSTNGFDFVPEIGNFNFASFEVYPTGYLNSQYGGFGESAWYWSTYGYGNPTYGQQMVFGPMITSGSPFIQLALTMNSMNANPVRCIRDEQETTPPTVSTDSVRYSTFNGEAYCYGVVTSHGGAPIVQKGVCWGTGFNPTLSGNHVEASDGGSGYITVRITGLTEGVYYMRAYAKTAAGTVVYGNDVSLQYMKPNVVMDSVTIDPNDPDAFYAHVRVTSIGSANCIRARLVVLYNTSHNPTFDDSPFAADTDICAVGSYTLHSRSLNVSPTTIYVRPCVLNGAGITYGMERPFTTGACHGQNSMSDQDGNIYNTVGIGNQCWMKSNLRTTHYSDGSVVAHGPSGSASSSVPYYYNYSSSGIPLEQRGYLYNWYAVMNGANESYNNPSGVQGICPNGWHVPSRLELDQLINQSYYVCGTPGYYTDTTIDYYHYDTIYHIAKALSSTSGWSSSSVECSPGNNQSTNNATGFSGVPTGYYATLYGSAHCTDAGEYTAFWTTSKSGNDLYDPDSQISLHTYYYLIISHEKRMARYGNTVSHNGLSVRCVKN